MCNASGKKNKLIATAPSTEKKQKTQTPVFYGFNVWLNENMQGKGKKGEKKLNNSIIGSQTRTDCQCCIEYQVVKCEGEHDEIV